LIVPAKKAVPLANALCLAFTEQIKQDQREHLDRKLRS
jgi:hypothetical protein